MILLPTNHIKLILLSWIFFGLTVMAGYQRTETPDGNVYYQQKNKIEKLSNDENSYKLIKLTNGLEALLVSHPKLVRVSAAVSVKVGSKYDPEKFRGLAHLCEHMLFLGNEKYSETDDFINFIKQSAGFKNAFTSFEETMYYFEIIHKKLPEGLDRLANMFIKPNFDYDAVANEVDILNQEFQSDMIVDEIRYDHVMRLMGNSSHPYTHYFRGNNVTLPSDNKPQIKELKEELHKFFDTYYSADVMKLVVMGRDSIEKLTKMVVDKFTDIPISEHQLKTLPDPVNPFSKDDNKKLIKILPIREESRLKLSFKVPNQDTNYNTKPSVYLDFVMCQSHQDSLINSFRGLKLAYNISCMITDHYSEFDVFEIEYFLTPEGEKQFGRMVTDTMDAINYVKKSMIDSKAFHELQHDLKLLYDFYKHDYIHQFTIEYAKILQWDFPPELVLSVEHLIFNFEKSTITDFIKALNYDNLRVALITRNNEKLKLEEDPIFGVQYHIGPLDEVTITNIKNTQSVGNIDLPGKNPFLSTRFDLIPDEIYEKPKSLIFESNGKLVHFNRHFQLPKAVIKTAIWTSRSNESTVALRDHVKLELLKEVIMLSLDEDNYNNDLVLAGYNYHIDIHYNRLELTLTGFSDKIQEVQAQIINIIKKPSKFLFLFTLCQRNFIAKSKSALLIKPLDQVEQLIKFALKLNPHKLSKVIKVAQEITRLEADEFTKGLFDQGGLNILVEGNLNEKEARRIFRTTLAGLEFHKLDDIQEYPYQLPPPITQPKSSYVYEQNLPPNITNFAIGYYLHLYEDENYQALSLILRSIMMDHIYTFMRIDRNLSYQFKVNNVDLFGRGGILILTESSFTCRELETQIERFLLEIKNKIETMKPDQFKYKKSVVTSELVGLKRNLASITNLHWSHFMDQGANFDALTNLLAAVDELQHQDLLDFIHSKLTPDSPHRHKLSIHLVPHKYTRDEYRLADHGKIIHNLTRWREKSSSSA